MRKSRLILMIAALIVGACLIALSQKVYAQNVKQDTRDIKQDKKDIAKDTADIKEDTTDHKEDTAVIKSDRQALRDAVESKDQNKIQQAKDKLHNDLKDTKKDKKAKTKKSFGLKRKKHHGGSGLKPGLLE